MAINDARSQMRLDVGPPESRRYSMLELISCAEREVKQRQRVYPRLIADKKMSRAFADSEIARMEAIANMLKDLAESRGLA